MKFSDAGVSLAVYFEGLRTRPYRDCVGYWTVGIGTLIGNGLSLHYSWNREFTVEECYALFRNKLENIESGIPKLITVELTQGQYDALVDFAYNLGLGTLQRSTLRQKLNRKDYEGAAKELLRFVKASGIIRQGLVLRRVAEMNMFLGLKP